MKNLLKLTTLSVLLIFFSSKNVYSCPVSTILEAEQIFDMSDTVFIGTPKKVECIQNSDEGTKYKVAFDIKKQWKGDNKQPVTILLKDNFYSNKDRCEKRKYLFFSQNHRYLVHINNNKIITFIPGSGSCVIGEATRLLFKEGALSEEEEQLIQDPIEERLNRILHNNK